MIRVKLFAQYRELLGDSVELTEVPLTVADLKKQVKALHIALTDLDLLVAVNHTVAIDEQEISKDDELAIFPPVTGG